MDTPPNEARKAFLNLARTLTLAIAKVPAELFIRVINFLVERTFVRYDKRNINACYSCQGNLPLVNISCESKRS